MVCEFGATSQPFVTASSPSSRPPGLHNVELDGHDLSEHSRAVLQAQKLSQECWQSEDTTYTSERNVEDIESRLRAGAIRLVVGRDGRVDEHVARLDIAVEEDRAEAQVRLDAAGIAVAFRKANDECDLGFLEADNTGLEQGAARSGSPR